MALLPDWRRSRRKDTAIKKFVTIRASEGLRNDYNLHIIAKSVMIKLKLPWIGTIASVLFAAAALTAHAAERVTVEQLEQKLAAQQPPKVNKVLQAVWEDHLAESLGNLALTERLSDARLQRISQKLQPGGSCKQALQLLAYRSAFFAPPADELPTLPPPDAEAQKLMITAAGAKVLRNLKQLPNFFATRTTTHYSGVPADMNTNSLVMRLGVFREGVSTREITFRGGEEVIDPMKANPGEPEMETGMESWGEFGPEPVMILMDALQGTIDYDHWEKMPTGLVAVFRYSVPRVRSHYDVHYKCPTNEAFQDTPPYHGSFSIDPATGALMRISLETESQPDDPITHIGSIIEYSPMEVGERSYICPVQSLVTMVEESSACAAKHHNPKMAQPILMINQTNFTDYHRLGSTSRLLDSNGNPPVPLSKDER
jgi:hypothetical protein